MHQCLHNQPKVYWAFNFLAEAERNWDGMFVGDCAIADYISSNWDLDRKEILIALLEVESAEKFESNEIPFWVMW